MTAQPTPEHERPRLPSGAGHPVEESDHEGLLDEVFGAPSSSQRPAARRHAAPGRHRGASSSPIPPVPNLASVPRPGRQIDEPGSRPASASLPPTLARAAVDAGRARHLAWGSSALGLVTALLVASSFLAMQVVFPWMRFFGGGEAASPGPAAVNVAPIQTLTNAKPSSAEEAIDEVIGFTPDAVRGWSETKQTKTVPSVSLGFGCDPTDGLSAVLARTRAWSKPDGSASLSISVRAYPAGTGALALDGVRQAALTCQAASVAAPAVGLGAEAAQVYSSRVSSLVWRRGDVLVIASTSAYSRAGSPGGYATDLRKMDERLDHALSGRCINQDAPTAVAIRSPYIGRKAYQPYTITETVPRPKATTAPTAASPSAGTSAPEASPTPVPIPAPTIEHPEAGDLPVKPVPAPTSGPTRLPAAVPVPQAPSAPSKPASSAKVARAVADTFGPGCGWAFTGQVPPVFDSATAEAAYARATHQAQAHLSAAWAAWQDAKSAYYRAYGAYQQAVATYSAYASRVAEVRSAWNAIDAARQAYVAALSQWTEQTNEARRWNRDHDKALAAYSAEQAACANQSTPPAVPTPSATSTPSPGAHFSPSTSATSSRTPDVSPSADPPRACPPTRPGVLDEQAPVVGPSPIPAPAAQLPQR